MTPSLSLPAPKGPFCSSCRAPIFWFKTKEKRLIPVNRGELAGVVGIIELLGDDRCRVLSTGEAAAKLMAGVRLYSAHFVTCPNAAQHRRKRGAK